jgi:hypothetical protein
MLLVVAAAITAHTALHQKGGTEHGYRQATIFAAYADFGIAAFVVGTALALRKQRRTARWFVVASCAIAVLAVVGAGAVTSEQDALFFISVGGLAAWGIWVFVLGIWLYLQPHPEAVPAPVPGSSAPKRRPVRKPPRP